MKDDLILEDPKTGASMHPCPVCRRYTNVGNQTCVGCRDAKIPPRKNEEWWEECPRPKFKIGQVVLVKCEEEASYSFLQVIIDGASHDRDDGWLYDIATEHNGIIEEEILEEDITPIS